jgi:hypothetical protein
MADLLFPRGFQFPDTQRFEIHTAISGLKWNCGRCGLSYSRNVCAVITEEAGRKAEINQNLLCLNERIDFFLEPSAAN